MSHTHKGNCQVCFRLQAVNNKTGLMAQHGYNVEYGFFMGVCWGSKNLPYQKSKDLIDEAIKRAERHLVLMAAQVEKLKTSTSTTVWVFGPNYKLRGCPMTWTRKVVGVDFYKRASDDDIARAVRYYHDEHAKAIEADMQSLKTHISILQNNANRWVPDAPLIAVTDLVAVVKHTYEVSIKTPVNE